MRAKNKVSSSLCRALPTVPFSSLILDLMTLDEIVPEFRLNGLSRVLAEPRVKFLSGSKVRFRRRAVTMLLFDLTHVGDEARIGIA